MSVSRREPRQESILQGQEISEAPAGLYEITDCRDLVLRHERSGTFVLLFQGNRLPCRFITRSLPQSVLGLYYCDVRNQIRVFVIDPAVFVAQNSKLLCGASVSEFMSAVRMALVAGSEQEVIVISKVSDMIVSSLREFSRRRGGISKHIEEVAWALLKEELPVVTKKAPVAPLSREQLLQAAVSFGDDDLVDGFGAHRLKR